MKKHLLSIFAVLIMALTLAMAMSVTAWADAEQAEVGYRYPVYKTVGEVTEAKNGIDHWVENGSCATCTTVTKDDTEWGESGQTKWYVATGDITINHTVTVKDDVHLILANGCNLTVNVTSGNGITVEKDCSLTIYAQSEGNDMGSLTVTGADDFVGIGSSSDGGVTEMGNLTVNGGKISVSKCATGLCGQLITISGGDISINCSKCGIIANEVNIAGGDVDVFGSDIGIYAVSFNMTGGDVTAKNSKRSETLELYSGIGCCEGNVTISGGSLNAIGGNFGIGVFLGNITISGDDTVVNASAHTSGICCVSGQDPNTILIKGASVTACSDTSAILATTINVSKTNFANENVFISAGEDAASVNTVFAGREDTTNLAPTGTSDEAIAASLSGNQYVRIGTAVCYVDADSSGTLNVGDTEYGSVQAAVNAAGETATTVRLIANDTENVTIPSKKNITLDLNGHYLLGKDTGFPNVIEVCEESSPGAKNAAKLTVVDSNADGLSHNFEVSDSGLWVLTDKANTKTYEDLVNDPAGTGDVIKVAGGVITSDNSKKDFRGIYVDDAYLTLKSGNIIGNGNCGVNNSGNFVMDGGLIAGNLAPDGYGAGVQNQNSFVMKGGKITNNISISGGVGGVNIAKSYSSFTMIGGTILANKGALGGGVGNGGTLNIGGSAKIYGNNGSVGKNLVTIGLITIGDSTNGSDGNTILKPDSGFTVGITLLGIGESGLYAKTGPFTTNGKSLDTQYFTSDNDDYVVRFVKGDTTKENTDPLYQDHLELATAYTVTEASCTNGSVSVGTTKKYAEGDEVTITNTPDNGYELDAYSVYKTSETATTVAVNNGKFTMPAYDVTVSATFKKKVTPVTTFAVKFDMQGHGTATAAQTVESGGKVKKPVTPTEDGYVFGGWFKEAECVNAWDFEKDTVTEDTTIYAKWSEEEPTPVVIKDGFMATGSAKAATNTIKWNAVEGADGYDIYYAKCGKTLKKIKSTTALKYTKKGLKTKNIYKYQIKAYEEVAGEKEYMATTPVIHIAGSKASRSNATKVTAKPDGVHMEAGDTQTIKTKIAKKSSKKTVLWKGHVSAKIRYMSTDKSVATVNSKGKITAKNEGTAYVYAYAASGAFAKILVIVE